MRAKLREIAKNAIVKSTEQVELSKYSNSIYSKIYKSGMQLLIDKKFPLQINLELSRACNYDCPFCARTEAEKGTHIDVELAKKIIDEANEKAKVTVFALHMWGEPLLNPKWYEIVSYIKTSNPQNGITLTTNGFLLNSKNRQLIVDAKIDQIIVSLHTINAEEYKVRVGKDIDVEFVISNMLELAKELSSEQSLICRLFDTFDEQKKYEHRLDEFRSAGIVIENDHYDNSAGLRSDWSSTESSSKRWPCYHPWLTTTITVHGDVSICCVDAKMDLKIGSVNNDTLENVWQSELVEEMRDEHLSGKFTNVCKACEGCDTWSTKPDFFFNFQKKNRP